MQNYIYEVYGFLDNVENEIKFGALSGEILKDKSEKNLNNNKAEIFCEDVIKVNNLLQGDLADNESELKEWPLNYGDNILEIEGDVIKKMSNDERTYNLAFSQVIEIDD